MRLKHFYRPAALSLVLILLMLSLVGCDSSPQASPTPAPTPSPTAAQTPEPQEETADEADDQVTAEELRRRYDIIKGNETADLLITNAKILDVYTEQVYDGSILIDGGRIVAINSPNPKARETFDAGGLYAVPGFIDGCLHFDSTMTTPEAIAETVVPMGTTTIIADILDFMGAAKEDGVDAAKALMTGSDQLACRFLFEAPGKKVDWDIAQAFVDWDACIAQGIFNFFDLLDGDMEALEQIAYAQNAGKLIHGQVFYDGDPYLANLWAAWGAMDDHNAEDYEQVLTDMRLGIAPMLRQGEVNSLDYAKLILPEIIEDDLPTDHMMFATDNISLPSLQEQGHINYIIQMAIDLGMDPIEAIKMGSYNTARNYGLSDDIGVVAPGRYADIVFLPSLTEIDPVYVFHNGELAAEDGAITERVGLDYSSVCKDPEPGLDDLTLEDLAIEPLEISEDGTQAKVTMLSVTTTDSSTSIEDVWMPYQDGQIVPEEDLLVFAMIERSPTDGERTIIKGYVNRFHLDEGAVAAVYSSINPYIGVFATSVDELYQAAKQIDQYAGGFMVTKDGAITNFLDLPIYGTMSTLPADELATAISDNDQQARAQGYDDPSPWYNKMNLTFWMLDRLHMLP